MTCRATPFRLLNHTYGTANPFTDTGKQKNYITICTVVAQSTEDLLPALPDSATIQMQKAIRSKYSS